MLNVVGIDFSSKAIDLVAVGIDDGVPQWTRVPISGSFSSSRNMRDLIPSSSWWDNTILCAVEKPMSQQYKSLSALMRLQGAILASIPVRVIVWELPPQEWKRECGLAGNAAKADVAVWAVDCGADDEWPQDAFDALAIAQAALRINDRAVTREDA